MNKKLEIKCPDYKGCNHNVTVKDFKNYCCAQLYLYYQCYFYSEKHTTKMTPTQWVQVKKIIEVKK